MTLKDISNLIYIIKYETKKILTNKKLKNVFYLIMVVLALVLINRSCDSGSSKTTKNYSTQEDWYVGGTLHKSNIADWRNATEKNKLATCSDFMATVDNNVSMTELKKRSEDLRTCIEKATVGVENIEEMPLSEVAANCIILLGY